MIPVNNIKLHNISLDHQIRLWQKMLYKPLDYHELRILQKFSDFVLNDSESLQPFFRQWNPFPSCMILIHWGLVTPYGDRDLGQHWFR